MANKKVRQEQVPPPPPGGMAILAPAAPPPAINPQQIAMAGQSTANPFDDTWGDQQEAPADSAPNPFDDTWDGGQGAPMPQGQQAPGLAPVQNEASASLLPTAAKPQAPAALPVISRKKAASTDNGAGLVAPPPPTAFDNAGSALMNVARNAYHGSQQVPVLRKTTAMAKGMADTAGHAYGEATKNPMGAAAAAAAGVPVGLANLLDNILNVPSAVVGQGAPFDFTGLARNMPGMKQILEGSPAAGEVGAFGGGMLAPLGALSKAPAVVRGLAIGGGFAGLGSLQEQARSPEGVNLGKLAEDTAGGAGLGLLAEGVIHGPKAIKNAKNKAATAKAEAPTGTDSKWARPTEAKAAAKAKEAPAVEMLKLADGSEFTLTEARALLRNKAIPEESKTQVREALDLRDEQGPAKPTAKAPAVKPGEVPPPPPETVYHRPEDGPNQRFSRNAPSATNADGSQPTSWTQARNAPGPQTPGPDFRKFSKREPIGPQPAPDYLDLGPDRSRQPVGPQPAPDYLDLSQGLRRPEQPYLDLDQGIRKADQSYLDLDQGIRKADQSYLDLDQGIRRPDQPYLDLDQGIRKVDQSYLDLSSPAPEPPPAPITRVIGGKQIALEGEHAAAYEEAGIALRAQREAVNRDYADTPSILKKELAAVEDGYHKRLQEIATATEKAKTDAAAAEAKKVEAETPPDPRVDDTPPPKPLPTYHTDYAPEVEQAIAKRNTEDIQNYPDSWKEFDTDYNGRALVENTTDVESNLQRERGRVISPQALSHEDLAGMLQQAKENLAAAKPLAKKKWREIKNALEGEKERRAERIKDGLPDEHAPLERRIEKLSDEELTDLFNRGSEKQKADAMAEADRRTAAEIADLEAAARPEPKGYEYKDDGVTGGRYSGRHDRARAAEGPGFIADRHDWIKDKIGDVKNQGSDAEPRYTAGPHPDKKGYNAVFKPDGTIHSASKEKLSDLQKRADNFNSGKSKVGQGAGDKAAIKTVADPYRESIGANAKPAPAHLQAKLKELADAKHAYDEARATAEAAHDNWLKMTEQQPVINGGARRKPVYTPEHEAAILEANRESPDLGIEINSTRKVVGDYTFKAGTTRAEAGAKVLELLNKQNEAKKLYNEVRSKHKTELESGIRNKQLPDSINIDHPKGAVNARLAPKQRSALEAQLHEMQGEVPMLAQVSRTMKAVQDYMKGDKFSKQKLESHYDDAATNMGGKVPVKC